MTFKCQKHPLISLVFQQIFPSFCGCTPLCACPFLLLLHSLNGCCCLLLSPKKNRSKPLNLDLQNSGNDIWNLAFNRPVLVSIFASESFVLELIFCFWRHADYINIQYFELCCWKLFTGYCDTPRADDRHAICALGSSLLWVFPHLRVSACLLVLLYLPIMHCAVLCSTSLSHLNFLQCVCKPVIDLNAVDQTKTQDWMVHIKQSNRCVLKPLVIKQTS